MAGATMKDGIEISIREGVPEVQEMLDTTEQENGRNLYYL